MKVSSVRALRGPNLWSRHTAIEAIVCCSETESLVETTGFMIRLRDRFPQIDLLQSVFHPGVGIVAHALERAALGLQIQAGCSVTFSRTIHTLDAGTYQVIVEYGEESVGRLAVEFAQTLCRAAIEDTFFDVTDAVNRLSELYEEIRFGPSTGAIVQAAVARGIPFRRLTNGSMVQFGWGNRQRRIQAAETGLTSLVAESIAQDKELTRTLLNNAGIPVAAGRPVANAADGLDSRL